MHSIWGNIFKRDDGPLGTRDLLKQIPIFSTLTNRELAAVERLLYRREYGGGDTIFRQGEPGVGMYIVAEGVVEIIYEPTGQILATLQKGEFFGEIALLNETPRSATARARTACILWGIFQPDLLSLLERNPSLGVKLLLALSQITGQRLVQADLQMHKLHEEAVRLEAALEQQDGEQADGT